MIEKKTERIPICRRCHKEMRTEYSTVSLCDVYCCDDCKYNTYEKYVDFKDVDYIRLDELKKEIENIKNPYAKYEEKSAFNFAILCLLDSLCKSQEQKETSKETLSDTKSIEGNKSSVSCEQTGEEITKTTDREAVMLSSGDILGKSSPVQNPDEATSRVRSEVDRGTQAERCETRSLIQEHSVSTRAEKPSPIQNPLQDLKQEQYNQMFKNKCTCIKSGYPKINDKNKCRRCGGAL